jgi:hypothetical protein
MDVLLTKQSGSGINSGFRSIDNQVYTCCCISGLITSSKLVADKAIYAESVSMLQYWKFERSTNTSMKS